MIAYLGSIPLGSGVLTGPTASGGREKSSYARHNVHSGKPVLQDMGDDLVTKKLRFFFDEGFCVPEVELGRLKKARAARQPLPYVAGDGSYSGQRFVVDDIDMDIKRTTQAGRTVRLEVTVTLIEAPVQDLVGFALAFARALAPAAAPAISALNVLVRR